MPLDFDLLDQARAAEARVIDAERDAEVARADFHRAVRRLQLAGGSLREIAEALNISHQRVHQIVAEAGGSRPWRGRISRGSRDHTIRCSFCGYAEGPGHRPIAGPGLYICEQCVALASEVIETDTVLATPLSAVKPLGPENATVRCSFCGKRRHQVPGLAAGAGGTICTECLALCNEIIAEQLA